MGYHRAGFEVVGVDISPQPNYPFEFHQADWLDYLAENHKGFDCFHASPPCQGYSCTKSLSRSDAPLLIGAVRDALNRTGKPYVIENVAGAKREMINPLTLRGNMFGLKVIRDRLFEVSPFLMAPPLIRHEGSTSSHRGTSRLSKGGPITVAGNNFLLAEGREAMGIDWMGQRELAQAIPPAYTEWIGQQIKSQCFQS
jgi:DNA (cytosine-5)-methyltransferase 1